MRSVPIKRNQTHRPEPNEDSRTNQARVRGLLQVIIVSKSSHLGSRLFQLPIVNRECSGPRSKKRSSRYRYPSCVPIIETGSNAGGTPLEVILILHRKTNQTQHQQTESERNLQPTRKVPQKQKYDSLNERNQPASLGPGPNQTSNTQRQQDAYPNPFHAWKSTQLTQQPQGWRSEKNNHTCERIGVNQRGINPFARDLIEKLRRELPPIRKRIKKSAHVFQSHKMLMPAHGQNHGKPSHQRDPKRQRPFNVGETMQTNEEQPDADSKMRNHHPTQRGLD